MSLMASTVHVRFGDEAPARAQDLVAAAVVGVLGDRFEEVGLGEWPDREVVVTPCDQGWVSVLDQWTHQSEQGLGLARQLSVGIDQVVVGFHHDPDLTLWLCRNGEVVNRQVLNWDGPTEGSDRNLDPWQEVLPPGRTVDDLAAKWDTERLPWRENPEILGEHLYLREVLEGCADVLGVKYDRSLRWDETYYPPGSRVLKLKHALLEPVLIRPASGPPRIEDSWSFSKRVEWPGDFDAQFNPMTTIRCVSAGGPGVGLEIVVRGVPIATGSVKPTAVSVVVGRDGTVRGGGNPVVGFQRTDDPSSWRASLPEVKVPGSFAFPPGPWPGVPLDDPRFTRDERHHLEYFRGDVDVQLRYYSLAMTAAIGGSIQGPSTGEIAVEMYPTLHPNNGVAEAIDVAVPDLNPRTVWLHLKADADDTVARLINFVDSVDHLPRAIDADIRRFVAAYEARDGDAFLTLMGSLVDRGYRLPYFGHHSDFLPRVVRGGLLNHQIEP